MKKVFLKSFYASILFIFTFIISIEANSDPICLRFEGDCNTYLYGQNGAAVLIDAGTDGGNVLQLSQVKMDF